MAVNAENIRQWDGADVYAGFAGSTLVFPTNVTSDIDDSLAVAGALSEDGFTVKRDSDTNETYAWGGTLVKQKRSKHKRTISVVFLEDNAVTFRIVNPGSTRDVAAGVTTSTYKTPTTEDIALVFETREGGIVRRRIVKKAQVADVADIKESEGDPTVYEVTFTVFPDADGVLYTDIEAEAV